MDGMSLIVRDVSDNHSSSHSAFTQTELNTDDANFMCAADDAVDTAPCITYPRVTHSSSSATLRCMPRVSLYGA